MRVVRGCLFDLRDAPLGGIFLELKHVVAGNNAVRIAAGKLNHALLVFDICGMIGLGKCGTSLVLGKVAVEIAIVRSEHKRWIPVDAQIL